MSIPFNMWSSGDVVNVSILLVAALGNFHVPSAFEPSTNAADEEGLVTFSQSTLRGSDGLWVVVGLRYVGPTTRGSWKVVIDVPLLGEQFSCALPDV